MLFDVLTKDALKRSRVLVFLKDWLLAWALFFAVEVALFFCWAFLVWTGPFVLLEEYGQYLGGVLRLAGLGSAALAFWMNRSSWEVEQGKK